MNDTIPRPRWAQLTYASQPDDAAGPAGWRVKDASADLTDAERETLLGFIVTNFEPTDPFPGVGYPDAVYEALTRRFGHVRTDHGSVTWHASQVDADGFGRAGNVFSHVLLDRRPSLTPPRHHPIALWRSRGILSPHQYIAIARSVIAPGEPEPSPHLSPSAVTEFLFDGDEWRIGRLARLAGAIAAALQGGPKVVVRVDDQDEAARWIAAVSLLLPLSLARRLGFSLFERANSSVGRAIRDVFAGGVHVAVVPRADEVLPAEDLVVIDLADDPESAEAATDIASLVEAVLFSSEDAAVVFEVIDRVGVLSHDAEVADPAWALAMSILLLGDQYPDALELARAVVVRASPPEIAEEEILRTIVEAAAADVLTGDAEALAGQLIKTPKSSFTHRLIATRYFSEALVDREWLQAPEARPHVDMTATGGFADAVRAARAAIESAADGGEASGTDGSLWRLRLLDFVVRCGVAGSKDDGGMAALVRRALADEVTLLARNEDDAGRILRACGPLSPTLVVEHLLPVLRERAHVSSDTVFATPPFLLSGLGIDAVVPDAVSTADDLDQDLAALRLHRDRPADKGLSLARAWFARWGGWSRLPVDGARLLEAHAPAWELREAMDAFDGRPVDLPAVLVIPAILRCREDAVLGAFESSSAPSHGSQVAEALEIAGMLCALETEGPEEWMAGGGLPDPTLELDALTAMSRLSLDIDPPARERVAAGVWILALSLLTRRRERSSLLDRGTLRPSLPWIDVTRSSGIRAGDAATYLVARTSVRGGASVAAEIAGLAAATSRGATTGNHILDLLATVPVADARGERAIDVVAERALLASGFDNREADPASRVLSWARMGEGDAEKLWRQWWKSRDSLSSKSGRESADFLGGLFRNRSREDS